MRLRSRGKVIINSKGIYLRPISKHIPQKRESKTVQRQDEMPHPSRNARYVESARSAAHDTALPWLKSSLLRGCLAVKFIEDKTVLGLTIKTNDAGSQ